MPPDPVAPDGAWPAVAVVIPALDEEESLPLVLRDLPRDRIREVVVVDNGSSDGTAGVALRGGATLVREPAAGYGRACLRGLAHLARKQPPPEVVVFLDGDYSDHPEELPDLVTPIVRGRADLVVGSRVLGRRERGALLPQARIGNLIAATLIRWLYSIHVTDLGPFRAVRWDALTRLGMKDPDYGWTAEMQVKAAKAGLRVVEVPVSYRRRVGQSKITGTLSGSVRAGCKILFTVFRHAR